MDRLEPRPPKANRIVLVVGVDFSESSEYALTLAKDLTRIAGADAEVHVTHVTAPQLVPDAIAGVLPGLGVDTASMQTLRERIVKLCVHFGKGTLMHFIPHLRVGEPAVEIADLAHEIHADLIVVGTHPRKGLSSALHRSIAARLARKAPCSVLTARLKEQEAEVEVEPPCEDCLAARRESGGTVQWCSRHGQHHIHPHQYFDDRAAGGGSWDFRS